MITIEIFISAMIGMGALIVIVGATDLFWILSTMRNDKRELREEAQEENRQLRAEIREGNQRIEDLLYRHRHDPVTGEAAVYPPAPD